MLEIFDRDHGLEYGGRSFLALEFILDKHYDNVKKSVRYYTENYSFVEASHIIARMINWFPWDLNKSAFVNFSNAKERSREIALLFGITTYEHKGDVLKGDFPFKEGYAFMSNETFSLNSNFKWREMNPLRLYSREGINYNLELPQHSSSMIEGFGIFHIDVPMLAVMAGEWHKEQLQKPVNERDSVPEFVGKYVLPKLIIDNSRCTYINMLSQGSSKALKRTIKSSNVPFAHIDQTASLLTRVNEIVEDFSNERLHHLQALKEFPGYDLGSLEELLPDYNNPILTGNNFWLYTITNMKFVDAVLAITPNDNDKDLLLRWEIIKRRIKGQNTFGKIPDDKLSKFYRKEYDRLEAVIKKKVN